MGAIPNSGSKKVGQTGPAGPAASALLIWILGLSLLSQRVPAAELPAEHAARVRQKYDQTRARVEAQPDEAEAVWQFGRASFDWADLSTNNNQRATIAEEAIPLLRRLVNRRPDLAAGHYYLALNLGQLARTRTLGALSLVGEMEREFKTARQLDAKIDYAGPDRSLGQLYRDAPGWPASIGSRSKARQHLQQSVAIAPEYPGNRLRLVETLWKWGDRREALREAEKFKAGLAQARERFSGESWSADWREWDERWQAFLEAAARVKAEH